MTDNTLAGKPLRYLIGADADTIVAHAGEVVEVPFDWNAAAPSIAIGIKYCNLFNENYGDQDTATRVSYGPYLTSSDTAKQYDEGQIDPHGAGWSKNLTEQFAKARAQGFLYLELDNPDAYSLSDVMGAIALAETYGLKVIAKNPGLTYGGDDATQAVAHPNIVGIIVEKDCGTPPDMDAMRQRAGKPDLPVWFVFFGEDERASAELASQYIRHSLFAGMSVTYSSKGEYGSSEDILLPIAAASAPVSPQPSPPMTDVVPPSLALARTLVGQVTDGPSILPLASAIAQKYPDMAAYCALVTPTTSWCGLFAGYCLAMNGIRPPYNPKVDVESFLWARAWLLFGTPVAAGSEHLGDILIFDFGGGDSHVTQYDGASGSNYLCLGGNQSDAVNVQSYPKTKCIGIRRAPLAGAVAQPAFSGAAPAPDPALAVELQAGAVGAAVLQLQALLGGIAADGEFGPDTDAAVRAYQTAHGLEVDGVVGPLTWASLLAPSGVKPAATTAAISLPQAVIDQIVAAARASAIAKYSWNDRGMAPIGYTCGMAVMCGLVYLKLKANDSAALAMMAPIGDPGKDALALYGVTAIDRAAIQRNLFALALGLGMRESSGNCFEGRDRSADNVTADTAEAGLFQQSWNSRTASPELPKLFTFYWDSSSDGFISIFREDVTPTTSGMQNFGSGEGAQFQSLCKSKPAFAVECCAVGLRVLRSHWGPIIRQEAELRPEAIALMQQVQQIVDSAAPPLIGIILPPLKPGQPDPSAPVPAMPATSANTPLLLLLILSQLENQMTTNPTPPAQAAAAPDLFGKIVADLPKLIALMNDPVLQKLMTGGAVTLQELLTLPKELIAALTGQTVATPPLLAAPATQPPATPPVTPAPPVVPVTPAATPAPTPALQKPSVQLSAVTGAAAWIAQLLGGLPAPVDMATGTTSTAGLLTTVLPLISMAVGSTGAFGSAVTAISGIWSALSNLKSK